MSLHASNIEKLHTHTQTPHIQFVQHHMVDEVEMLEISLLPGKIYLKISHILPLGGGRIYLLMQTNTSHQDRMIMIVGWITVPTEFILCRSKRR